MLTFDVITLFPDYFRSPLDTSLTKRALGTGRIRVNLHNLRDYAEGPHRQVDDYPYGGGEGMILKPEPIFSAVEQIKIPQALFVCFSPRGQLFNQTLAKELYFQYDHFLLLAGRYEGIDERVATALSPLELSLGDYILNGGDVAALVFIEVLSRFVPGVIGKIDAIENDSFSMGLLEWPQYTRPPEFRGMKIPEVLQSGNHQAIERWKREEALKVTAERRPDLIEKFSMIQERRKK